MQNINPQYLVDQLVEQRNAALNAAAQASAYAKACEAEVVALRQTLASFEAVAKPPADPTVDIASEVANGTGH